MFAPLARGALLLPRVSPSAPRRPAVSSRVVIASSNSSSKRGETRQKKRQDAAETSALLALVHNYDDESLSLSKTVRQSHARAVTATHDVHHDRADEDEAADAAEAAAAADAADTESPGARLKPPQRSVKNRLLPGLKSHGTVTKKRGLLQQKEAVTKDALKQKNGGKAKGQAAQVHVVPADNQQQRVVDYLTRTGRMRGHAKLSDVVQCRYAASDPRVHQPRYRCVVTYANLEECVLLQEEAVEDECPEAKAVVGRWCAGKREAKEDALGGLLGWLTAEDEKNGCADE